MAPNHSHGLNARQACGFKTQAVADVRKAKAKLRNQASPGRTAVARVPFCDRTQYKRFPTSANAVGRGVLGRRVARTDAHAHIEAQR